MKILVTTILIILVGILITAILDLIKNIFKVIKDDNDDWDKFINW